jgi:hypothetical protein
MAYRTRAECRRLASHERDGGNGQDFLGDDAELIGLPEIRAKVTKVTIIPSTAKDAIQIHSKREWWCGGPKGVWAGVCKDGLAKLLPGMEGLNRFSFKVKFSRG